MGISGFKFGQRHERDDKSSGEVLVSPTARYRVVGIQNNESARDRRAVFLHPTPASEISPGEIQKTYLMVKRFNQLNHSFYFSNTE